MADQEGSLYSGSSRYECIMGSNTQCPQSHHYVDALLSTTAAMSATMHLLHLHLSYQTNAQQQILLSSTSQKETGRTMATRLSVL